MQAAQGKAARKKLGKGGKLDPQHLSPACVWLDAQHDARHGTRFIESITGQLHSTVLFEFMYRSFSHRLARLMTIGGVAGALCLVAWNKPLRTQPGQVGWGVDTFSLEDLVQAPF